MPTARWLNEELQRFRQTVPWHRRTGSFSKPL
jgi:hypothetical protein